jgi:hypothetical protein
MTRDLMIQTSSEAAPSPEPLRTDRTWRTTWLAGLVSVLGVLEVLMAMSVGSVTVLAIGLAGGLALIAAPWLTGRVRRWGLLLLLIGAVPFAVATWWALVPPLLAVVALAIGISLARRRS